MPNKASRPRLGLNRVRLSPSMAVAAVAFGFGVTALPSTSGEAFEVSGAWAVTGS